MRALARDRPIVIRNPDAIRPWQHVLDALAAYLHLGERLYNASDDSYCTGWNFGPERGSEKTVMDLVSETVRLWGSGEFTVRRDPDAPKESVALCLNCDKAHRLLGWRPVWDFHGALGHAVEWYKAFTRGSDMRALGEAHIEAFSQRRRELGIE
jgi:CDP-glucose 4,6-dehydratase